MVYLRRGSTEVWFRQDICPGKENVPWVHFSGGRTGNGRHGRSTGVLAAPTGELIVLAYGQQPEMPAEKEAHDFPSWLDLHYFSLVSSGEICIFKDLWPEPPERAHYCCGIFTQNLQPPGSHGKIPSQPKLRITLQTMWPVFLKNVKVMEDWETVTD